MTRLSLSVCLLGGLLAGCAEAEQASQGRTNLATSAGQTPLRALPDCPAEQLSCGKQQPVVAAEGQIFVNEDMRLSAVFPAGSRVCMARSGDAARGFYSTYGLEVQGCPERGDLPATRMGINSIFNALDYPTVDAALADRECLALSPQLSRRLGAPNLRIGGHRTRICQSDEGGGWIGITLHALAGQRHGSPADNLPVAEYTAFLSTSPERFDQDIPMFLAFVDRLRIGLP